MREITNNPSHESYHHFHFHFKSATHFCLLQYGRKRGTKLLPQFPDSFQSGLPQRLTNRLEEQRIPILVMVCFRKIFCSHDGSSSTMFLLLLKLSYYFVLSQPDRTLSWHVYEEKLVQSSLTDPSCQSFQNSTRAELFTDTDTNKFRLWPGDGNEEAEIPLQCRPHTLAVR